MDFHVQEYSFYARASRAICSGGFHVSTSRELNINYHGNASNMKIIKENGPKLIQKLLLGIFFVLITIEAEPNFSIVSQWHLLFFP